MEGTSPVTATEATGSLQRIAAIRADVRKVTARQVARAATPENDWLRAADLCPAMVARLRAKPGGSEIGVTIGDFATATVGRTLRLAYLVFNTIGNLTSQDEQVACFANAAGHLDPGGYFVIEVEVPALQRLPPGERFRPFSVTPGHLGFDEYDVASQRLISHHCSLSGGQARVLSMPFRYVWPAELDLMARLAGLTLRERWGGWDREPFTSDSTKHVSVRQKPA